MGINGTCLGTAGCMTMSFSVSCLIFYDSLFNCSVTYLKLGKWLDSELLTTYFGFQFDSLTSMMLVVITSISGVVHIYSTGYMSAEPHLQRFLSYLSLFTLLMLVLVTSDNYVQLFIG